MPWTSSSTRSERGRTGLSGLRKMICLRGTRRIIFVGKYISTHLEHLQRMIFWITRIERRFTSTLLRRTCEEGNVESNDIYDQNATNLKKTLYIHSSSHPFSGELRAVLPTTSDYCDARCDSATKYNTLEKRRISLRNYTDLDMTILPRLT